MERIKEEAAANLICAWHRKALKRMGCWLLFSKHLLVKFKDQRSWCFLIPKWPARSPTSFNDHSVESFHTLRAIQFRSSHCMTFQSSSFIPSDYWRVPCSLIMTKNIRLNQGSSITTCIHLLKYICLSLKLTIGAPHSAKLYYDNLVFSF